MIGAMSATHRAVTFEMDAGGINPYGAAAMKNGIA